MYVHIVDNNITSREGINVTHIVTYAYDYENINTVGHFVLDHV